jgi:hypothetical protein
MVMFGIHRWRAETGVIKPIDPSAQRDTIELY